MSCTENRPNLFFNKNTGHRERYNNVAVAKAAARSGHFPPTNRAYERGKSHRRSMPPLLQSFIRMSDLLLLAL